MRENDYFHFKQFTVSHRNSSMKVGTDGVLLGAWTEVGHATDLLDIGTGTGLIALMLAQRTSQQSFIDAVESDTSACLDASENFHRSPWRDRLHLRTVSIQDYHPKKQYDIIVSNPPYFINSLKPPDTGRRYARHADSLTFNDLIEATERLLKPDGRLEVILPEGASTTFTALAARSNLHCRRVCHFRTRQHKGVERRLMEFSFGNSVPKTEQMCLYESGDTWTEDYRNLTSQFYLKG